MFIKLYYVYAIFLHLYRPTILHFYNYIFFIRVSLFFIVATTFHRSFSSHFNTQMHGSYHRIVILNMYTYRKIEASVSFVGGTRDVDLDERDFRVGYLLSEWRDAIGACAGLGGRCANLIPFCSFPSTISPRLCPTVASQKVATNDTKRNAVRSPHEHLGSHL